MLLDRLRIEQSKDRCSSRYESSDKPDKAPSIVDKLATGWIIREGR
jgi:hypothetical protein